LSFDEGVAHSPSGPVSAYSWAKGLSKREGDGRRWVFTDAGMTWGQESEADSTATHSQAVGPKRRERCPAIDRADHALSLCRPLWRRERRTALPPRVDMRARKPCFIARLRLLGWNVRLTIWTPGNNWIQERARSWIIRTWESTRAAWQRRPGQVVVLKPAAEAGRRLSATGRGACRRA